MIWAGIHTGKHNLWLHACFWSAWVLSFTILQSMGQGSRIMLSWLWYYLLTLPIFVAHTYLIAYRLIPATFKKKQYLIFAGGLMLMLTIFSVIELVWSNEYIFPWVGRQDLIASNYLTPENIFLNGLGNHYVILVFMAVKVGQAWYCARSEEVKEQQWNRDTETEISGYRFRPQVMLHLMELLEEILHSNPEKSPEFIIRISDFLNKFLEVAGKKKIYLHEEIQLTKLYLDIHTMALPEQFSCDFSADGDTNCYSSSFTILQVLHNAFILAGQCNNLCNCNVFIENVNNQLHFSFRLKMDAQMHWNGKIVAESFFQALRARYQDKMSFSEERNAFNLNLDAVDFLRESVINLQFEN